MNKLIYTIFLIYLSSLIINVTCKIKERSPSDVVSKECKEKVHLDKDLEECKQRADEKWNNTMITCNYIKKACCQSWDITDCTEPVVKAKCSKTDYDKLHEYYMTKGNDRYGLCMNYLYYSTKCTILETDFEKGVSTEDKNRWLTKINLPSKSCQDYIDSYNCEEKVAKKAGYSQDDLKDKKTKHIFECCKYNSIVDCKLKAAKVTDKCNHQDVNGLILMGDMYRDKTSKGCEFKWTDQQCYNNSNKIKNSYIIYIMVIFVARLFFK